MGAQYSSAGSYQFTITGTNLVSNDTETFVINVISQLDLDDRIHHMDTRFVNLSRSGQNDPSYTSTIEDLIKPKLDATLYGFDQTTAWDGAGTSADPVSLVFDGVDDYVQVASSVSGDSYVRFEAWVYPGSNDREKVIFSYGNATENGMILTSRRLWLGKGNSAYATTVLADSPYVYYRMDNLAGGIATDSSGNNRDGLVNTVSSVTDDADDAVFNLESTGGLFQGGYIDPNITTGAVPVPIDITNDWTLETWFYYPFPTGCTSGCYLSRSSTASSEDDRVLVVTSSQQLRTYLRNQSGWHYPTPTDNSLTRYDFGILEEAGTILPSLVLVPVEVPKPSTISMGNPLPPSTCGPV